MTWPEHIERWRQFVLWECRDIPPDLVLAITKHESNGVPGIASSATTKPHDIPLEGGGHINYNHALGLMQIIPGTIASYNAGHPADIVFYEDMKGTDERAARLQIRVGCAVYASGIRNLHNYDPAVFTGNTPGNATIDQLMFALTAYARGFGALRVKLNQLKAQNMALTFANLAQTFPTWGQNAAGEWINRPIQYTETVWNNAINHGMEPGEGTSHPPGPSTGPPDTLIAGFDGPAIAMAMGILILSWKLWKGLQR